MACQCSLPGRTARHGEDGREPTRKQLFLYRRQPDFFLPPKADFLYLRLFSMPTGRRGWGWRRMSESVLSMTLPTATNAKGAALKSRKSFCIYITLIMHTTTASDTFFLPFRLTMSIIIRSLTAVYAKRYNKTEWNDSLMTKEHETDYLFSMAANEMRVGMAAIRMR